MEKPKLKEKGEQLPKQKSNKSKEQKDKNPKSRKATKAKFAAEAEKQQKQKSNKSKKSSRSRRATKAEKQQKQNPKNTMKIHPEKTKRHAPPYKSPKTTNHRSSQRSAFRVTVLHRSFITLHRHQYYSVLASTGLGGGWSGEHVVVKRPMCTKSPSSSITTVTEITIKQLIAPCPNTIPCGPGYGRGPPMVGSKHFHPRGRTTRMAHAIRT